MQSLVCPLCAHANPAGAKFCNECGSPLKLVACKRCDAINRASAGCCYRCGAPLASSAPAPDAQERDSRPIGLDAQAQWVEEELRRFEHASPPEPERIEHEIRALDGNAAGTDPEHAAIEIEATPIPLGASSQEPERAVTAPEHRRPVEVANRGSQRMHRELVSPYVRPRIPEARSLFSDLTERPSRWREFAGGTAALLLAAAIVAGGYRYYGEALSPGMVGSAAAPPVAQDRTTGIAPAPPAAATVPAVVSTAPLVKEVPPVLRPEAPPAAAPFQPEVAHGGAAPVKPPSDAAPLAKLAPPCPPAVAALALCDWIGHATSK